MLNQMLKFSALIVAGRFLRPRLKGLLLLLATWFVITYVHGEYIAYVTLTGNSSFYISAAIIKLLAYLLSFLAYVVLVERRLLLKRPPKRRESDSRSVPPASPRSLPATTSSASAGTAGGADDGFDFLRHKKKLSGSDEKLLGK